MKKEIFYSEKLPRVEGRKTLDGILFVNFLFEERLHIEIGNNCLTINLLVMNDSKDFSANGTGCSAEFSNPSYFSESAFWAKLKRFAKSAGAKVVYYALLLYYAFISPKTQGWAKTVIIGALAYFICPIDTNPDFIPIVGFLDDLAILATTLKIVDVCITSDVKAKAKAKLGDWFGYAKESELV